MYLQSSTELVDLFGLGPEEELLERFACALLQTYHCSHNTFTPEQQVTLVAYTCAVSASLICRVRHLVTMTDACQACSCASSSLKL